MLCMCYICALYMKKVKVIFWSCLGAVSPPLRMHTLIFFKKGRRPSGRHLRWQTCLYACLYCQAVFFLSRSVEPKGNVSASHYLALYLSPP